MLDTNQMGLIALELIWRLRNKKDSDNVIVDHLSRLESLLKMKDGLK